MAGINGYARRPTSALGQNPTSSDNRRLVRYDLESERLSVQPVDQHWDHKATFRHRCRVSALLSKLTVPDLRVRP